MDPVSHAVFGRTIVAALENRDRTRFGSGAGVAAILGALSPDVDCFLMPAGWDIHLRFHEIGTHSLPGGILAGCAWRRWLARAPAAPDTHGLPLPRGSAR